MDKDWQKIKQCFTSMREAPDEAPQGCKTHQQLSKAAAKFMKPRADAMTIRKLTSRIQFIAFGE